MIDFIAPSLNFSINDLPQPPPPPLRTPKKNFQLTEYFNHNQEDTVMCNIKNVPNNIISYLKYIKTTTEINGVER